MASIYDIKPGFQSLLRPATRGLAALGATANQVTTAALVLSLAVGSAVYTYGAKNSWPLYVLPCFLFLRMALNAIDGMLAREHQMESELGALLNELGDVVSDTALYLPLALLPGVPTEWMVVAVCLAMVSEMAGVCALQIGATRRYDGPMGKSDRAFIFGVLSLALALGWRDPAWIERGLIAVVLLLLVTIFNRVRRALAEVSVRGQ